MLKWQNIDESEKCERRNVLENMPRSCIVFQSMNL